MRKTTWAWVSPLALLAAMALAGCGGGGGGGGSSNSGGGGSSSTLSQPAVLAIAGDTSGANAGNNLSWSTSVDSGGSVVTYNIYRSTAAVFTASSATLFVSGLTATNYHDSSAVGGTTYYYAISAAASDAPTVYSSNEASATPGGPTTNGAGDPAGGNLPNSLYKGATYSLYVSGTSVSRFVLSITFSHAVSPADLKSVQFKGTVYNLTSTTGITQNGTTGLVFDSQAAGLILTTLYNPVQTGNHFSITANVATTSGGTTTAPLELTGSYNGTPLSQTAIDFGAPTNENFEFDINQS